MVSRNRRISNSRRRSRRGRQRNSNSSFQPMRTNASRPGNNLLVRDLVKWVDLGQLTSSSTSFVGYGFSFNFSMVSDYSAWSSVFDQYRLTRVDFRLEPLNLPALPTTLISSSFLWLAVDYDDASTPASVAAVSNYSNACYIRPGRSYGISFVPRLASSVQVSGGSSSPAGVTTGWIDSQYSTVNHYGIKIALTQATTTNLIAWYAYARLHFSLRSAR